MHPHLIRALITSAIATPIFYLINALTGGGTWTSSIGSAALFFVLATLASLALLQWTTRRRERENRSR